MVHYMQPLLYQNEERTVVLIDIPASIAAAQATCRYSPCHTLLSAEPQKCPYETNDPKSIKARAKLNGNTANAELESTYEGIIQDALTEVRSKHTGDWCLPRELMPPTGRRSKKRKLDNFNSKKTDEENPISSRNPTGLSEQIPSLGPENLSYLLQCLTRDASGSSGNAETYRVSYRAHKSVDTAKPTGLGAIPNHDEQTWDPVHSNPHHHPVELTIQQSSASINVQAGHTFYIPPECTFILGDCREPATLRTAVRNAAQERSDSRRFDFILLDPPWPNASVKRQNTYSTGFNLRDTKQLIVGMDLDTLIAANGLVGVWVTNKPAVRSLVLGLGGLFESLNVGLTEEWIWVKTTVDGQPITAIDGLWRKPYEVLLLARAPEDPLQVATEATAIKRRVIVGVPDLHSRKPCLKSLIEPYMPDQKNYRALEIFARYLVAGWWSWGDEVLKFSWDSCWTHELSNPSEHRESPQV